ncbi:hypothetical protein CRYUN_Cryun36dG0043900 [Craigia yunnanensis]
MALSQSSQMKMLVVFLAIMVLMSSAAAVSHQDVILKPLSLGRKLLDSYYGTPTAYPGVPSGGGSNPCCK